MWQRACRVLQYGHALDRRGEAETGTFPVVYPYPLAICFDCLHTFTKSSHKQERVKYVRLISAEGVDFYVERKAACVSNTIKQMLGTDSEYLGSLSWELCTVGGAEVASTVCTPAGGFIEGEKGEISFPEINTPILEKVCQYFYFKLRYQNT